jgi:hypothetical protein
MNRLWSNICASASLPGINCLVIAVAATASCQAEQFALGRTSLARNVGTFSWVPERICQGGRRLVRVADRPTFALCDRQSDCRRKMIMVAMFSIPALLKARSVMQPAPSGKSEE